MASHRAAAALLLIASLVMEVAVISEADARPAVRPDKTAALSGADVGRTGGNTKLTTVRRDDAHHGPGYVAAAVVPDDKLVKTENKDEDVAGTAAELVKPVEDDDDDCRDDDEDDDNEDDHEQAKDQPNHPKDQPENNSKNPDGGHPQPGGLPRIRSRGNPGTTMTTDSAEAELDQELCTTCEQPKKAPEPKCNTCEPDPKPEPEMTCNKVHAVREGETCDSVGQCAELIQDDFLRFNPNLCCEKLFVGQWVCLDATCAA